MQKKKIVVCSVALAALVVVGCVYGFSIQKRNRELVAAATDIVTLTETAYYVPEPLRTADQAEVDAYKQEIHDKLSACMQEDSFSCAQAYDVCCDLIDEQFETGAFYLARNNIPKPAPVHETQSCAGAGRLLSVMLTHCLIFSFRREPAADVPLLLVLLQHRLHQRIKLRLQQRQTLTDVLMCGSDDLERFWWVVR